MMPRKLFCQLVWDDTFMCWGDGMLAYSKKVIKKILVIIEVPRY